MTPDEFGQVIAGYVGQLEARIAKLESTVVTVPPVVPPPPVPPPPPVTPPTVPPPPVSPPPPVPVPSGGMTKDKAAETMMRVFVRRHGGFEDQYRSGLLPRPMTTEEILLAQVAEKSADFGGGAVRTMDNPPFKPLPPTGHVPVEGDGYDYNAENAFDQIKEPAEAQ